jgi:hypothetical protein
MDFQRPPKILSPLFGSYPIKIRLREIQYTNEAGVSAILSAGTRKYPQF